VEDLDFSPERGLERRLVLELSQLQLGRPGPQYPRLWRHRHRKKFRGFVHWVTAAIRPGYSVRYFRTARFLLSLTRARQEARTSIYCALFPEPMC